MKCHLSKIPLIGTLSDRVSSHPIFIVNKNNPNTLSSVSLNEHKSYTFSPNEKKSFVIRALWHVSLSSLSFVEQTTYTWD
jgi:hypothetical protein